MIELKRMISNFSYSMIDNVIYNAGMRFFRNFVDLKGHSRGNLRSSLIFMGGGGTILCLLADRQQCWDGTTYIPHYQPILNTESSQVAGVCTTSTCSIA